STFRYLLVDVQASQHYYVESQGVRSPEYSMDVINQAHVQQIDLTYHFPAYTGMPPQTVDDEGDISALKGTKLDLRIKLSDPVQSSSLVFDDLSKIDLNAAETGEYTGSFVLQRPGTYVVEVSEFRGGSHPASTEYEIEVVEDGAPKVTFIRPMRDVRATSVEEVFSEIKAEDDLGMGKVELRYSVNGDPEESLRLYRGNPEEKSVVVSHTFFLEELGLQPGDLISYYASAWDSNNATGPTVSSSDIYFIQVRPFQQDYKQNQQQGMQGGQQGEGENEGGQEALSRQQKEIISATFKLIRDKARMDSKEYGGRSGESEPGVGPASGAEIAAAADAGRKHVSRDSGFLRPAEFQRQGKFAGQRRRPGRPVRTGIE
ncbi:MAG: hypothetical protein P8Z37_04140, partial [Acidobacteriota bacterium]